MPEEALARAYGTALALDLLAGWQWRLRLGETGELEAGPGFHLCLVALEGRPNDPSFSAAPLGVGAGATARWRVLGPASPWSLALLIGGSLDLYDPLHEEQLHGGGSFRAGLLATWEPR